MSDEKLIMDEERRNNELREIRDEVIKDGVRIDHISDLLAAHTAQDDRRFSELNHKIDSAVVEIKHDNAIIAEHFASFREEWKADKGRIMGIMTIIVPILTALIGLAAKHYFGW